jgi:DtxR family Mn-dependent transcriptional regulator
MLKSLAEEGLVDYRPYRGARLTDDGRAEALKVIRSHRLIEVFLVNTLGYSWDEVHDEAERLEHAVSEELVSRIETFLGHPQFDPHGDPIPTADGEIHRPEATPLSEAEENDQLRVERVLDQEPEVLRYLERIGLTPNSTFEVVEVLPFDGQMFLRVDDEDASISQVLASRVLVTPA